MVTGGQRFHDPFRASMTDFPILRDLGLILVTAALVLLVARRLRVPPILAYMIAGLLLGPATGLLHATEGVDLISEVGIALLLFLVGLELSLEKIRDVGRAAVLAGVGQILLTFGLGFLLALGLGMEPLPAGLLALGLTFSSTVVVVKLLDRRGDLHALYGRIAVGILLVQDVAVAIALTLLAGMEDPSALSLEALGRGLLRATLGMSALIALAVAATRLVLPRLFGWLSGSLEALFVWSLTWCFGFILAAQTLGLSVEIGAFVAGVSLAQLRYNEELIRRVHPLVNFFLAVFFVSLGVHMEVASALARWPSVLVLTLFVLLVKPAILMALIPRLGYGERTSFLTALTLGQISEFSFIVASLALGAGLVGEEFLAVIGAVGLLTIGSSAALIQTSDRSYRWLADRGVLRPFRAERREEAAGAPELEGHIVVVGMNTLGRRLVEEFVRRGERVLAIDTDPSKLEGLPPCAQLIGNTEYPSVLEHAHLGGAKLLVSALQIEDANNLLAYRARRAGVPSSIHAFDPILSEELREHGATHLMVSKNDGIRQVAEALRREGLIA
jgi:Kef-type K+ transport system membrane component KefB